MKKIFKNGSKALFVFLILSSDVLFAQREFWGIAQGVDYNLQGIIYKLDSAGSNFQVVYSFDSISNVTAPSSMTLASNGKLYLTRTRAANNFPSKLYEFDIETFAFQSWNYPIDAPSFSDPVSGDLLETDGFLYGATGASANWFTGQRGKMYRFNLSTQTFETCINNPTFLVPQNGMVKANNGLIYGTLSYIQFSSSEYYFGGLYSYNPTNNTFNYRVRFGEFGESPYPLTNLTIHPNGNIYGITTGSFSIGVPGALFEYNTLTNTYLEKHSFGSPSASPSGNLTLGNDSTFYGVTYSGNGGSQTLYSYNPVTDSFSVRLNFPYYDSLFNSISIPRGELLKASNGLLYGFAENCVYSFNPSTGQANVTHQFLPNSLGYTDTPNSGRLIEICRKPRFTPFANDSITVCSNSTFEFTIHSPNATSFSWTKNGIVLNTQNDSTLTLNQIQVSDSGYYSCILTNTCGNIISDSVFIRTKPESTFTQSINICAGETFTVGGQTYIQSGNYQNILTATNGCDSTVTTTLFIDTLQAQIQNTGLALEALNTPFGANFQWLDCNNNFAPIVGETNAAFTPIIDGNYSVLVSNSNCSDTSGCENFTITGLGITSIEKFKATIYPNPTNGILTIEISNTLNESSYSLFDNLGRQILKGSLLPKKTLIDMNNINSGIYHLKILDTYGNQRTLKIIKE